MVESTALEMRHTGNRIGGSNPSLSAKHLSVVVRPFEKRHRRGGSAHAAPIIAQLDIS